MMLQSKELKVGTKTYYVQKMDFFSTLKLQMKTLNTFGGLLSLSSVLFNEKKTLADLPDNFIGKICESVDAEKISELFPIIFKQIFTASNECLGDEAIREKWFEREENRGDVWLVFIGGLLELVGELLPSSLSISVSGLKEMLKSMSTLKTPTDTTHTPLSPSRSKEG